MADAGPKDLLTLVLRSRKALDHTQTLCLRADTLAKESTTVALDLVAVDAKVRWIAEVISEQFKVRFVFYLSNKNSDL
jgi:autophagy-related protein 17